ncbi:MAG: hypothetical protein CMH80_04345 [Nitrospinae bacterium]|nr:hypothetical protein [Nitrospinota bacterium]
MEAFDIVIIGAGPAGISAALRGADQGARVCLIEQDRIGGSSFHKGVYPYKDAIAALNDRTSDIHANGIIDIEKFSHRVNRAIEAVLSNRASRLNELGVEIRLGRGILLSPSIVQVETDGVSTEVLGEKIIIATGSHPVALPTLPFEKDVVLSADNVFQSNKLPASVFIMGGGASGCELATLYRRLGSKVFLSHQEPRLLTGQDPDIIDAVESSLKKLKVKILPDKKLSSYFKNDGMLDMTLSGGVKFQVEKIVLNLDREGNSLNLGCEDSGIRLGEHEEILVNEVLETSTAGIFAVGSVTGRKTTTGISEEEGRVAADNAMGKNKAVNSDWTPFLIGTEPEIACVGCFAEEAHHKGFRAVEGKFLWENLDYSLLRDEAGGFCKITADARSGVVLGGQIYSNNASQLISLVLLAMKKGMKVGALASLACDGAGENHGIREAARSCSRALKAQRNVL